MKIVAINGTYRPEGTTTALTRRALEGAGSRGAETEMILLKEQDIRTCTNCLRCYRDAESEMGPCSLDDGMTAVVRKVLEADGVLFASPVHNGFLTGGMTAFFERLVWRVCKPTGRIASIGGMPVPRSSKTRALASIVSAGAMPRRLRKMCDGGTAFLKENGNHFLNGTWAGDVYAHADLSRLPENEGGWRRMYDLRKLSAGQLQEAFDLGVRMADMIQRGELRPHRMMGPVVEAMTGLWLRMGRVYKIAG
jgi:NAD(P)H-dependent FMN reductase